MEPVEWPCLYDSYITAYSIFIGIRREVCGSTAVDHDGYVLMQATEKPALIDHIHCLIVCIEFVNSYV